MLRRRLRVAGGRVFLDFLSQERTWVARGGYVMVRVLGIQASPVLLASINCVRVLLRSTVLLRTPC